MKNALNAKIWALDAPSAVLTPRANQNQFADRRDPLALVVCCGMQSKNGGIVQ